MPNNIMVRSGIPWYTRMDQTVLVQSWTDTGKVTDTAIPDFNHVDWSLLKSIIDFKQFTWFLMSIPTNHIPNTITKS